MTVKTAVNRDKYGLFKVLKEFLNFLKKVLTFGAARSIINTVLKRETKVNKLVLMTLRVHLFPYRTQKLSSVVPKILGW